MFAPEIQRRLFNRYSSVDLKPEWDALKKTLELCETEEMNTIAKSVMTNSSLKPQQLKRKLNLNIDSTRKSITKVQQASEKLSKYIVERSFYCSWPKK